HGGQPADLPAEGPGHPGAGGAGQAALHAHVRARQEEPPARAEEERAGLPHDPRVPDRARDRVRPARLARLGSRALRPADPGRGRGRAAARNGGEFGMTTEIAESPFTLELSDDQRDIRDWVHGFAEDVVRPAAAEWDEREETPWPVIQEA